MKGGANEPLFRFFSVVAVLSRLGLVPDCLQLPFFMLIKNLICFFFAIWFCQSSQPNSNGECKKVCKGMQIFNDVGPLF